MFTLKLLILLIHSLLSESSQLLSISTDNIESNMGEKKSSVAHCKTSIIKQMRITPSINLSKAYRIIMQSTYENKMFARTWKAHRHNLLFLPHRLRNRAKRVTQRHARYSSYIHNHPNDLVFVCHFTLPLTSSRRL